MKSERIAGFALRASRFLAIFVFLGMSLTCQSVRFY